MVSTSNDTGMHEWLLTCFYGNPNKPDRITEWNFIVDMASHVSQPWILLGDLNSVFDQSKKKGGIPFNFNDVTDIKSIIAQVGLLDLGFVGPTFTWYNGQNGWARIHKRLDRALGNSDLTSLFPNVLVEHLAPVRSDHAPITISTSPSVKSLSKTFRFFNLWLKEDNCI
ncbi:Endonuclease/exonuclease/phosphatase [Macleaya cordata]|uniref:Endonuclease/exonuclease/phosphatase n=1 Tax=Macleaya cordata TaxID=56857 RepID=A0A200QW61_MACCD|nr:Endonuclease/exonuclease/phosphatase [Macleaya cordata]